MISNETAKGKNLAGRKFPCNISAKNLAPRAAGALCKFLSPSLATLPGAEEKRGRLEGLGEAFVGDPSPIRAGKIAFRARPRLATLSFEAMLGGQLATSVDCREILFRERP